MMNVIMITMDGLRRDHVSKIKSLNSFIARSKFYSGIITAAPYTIASMHAVFSGTYPSRNGVDSYYNMFRFKKNKFKTLTQYLKDAGYNCTADVINDSILPRDGFDAFGIHDENKDDLAERHETLLESMNGKFFLYLHYSNIHTGLIKDVQKRYTDMGPEFFAMSKENKQRYEGYMAGCNAYLERILGKISQLGYDSNSIIIILSDHGVSLGEKNGERMYGCFVFDYTLKTFCVISMPGQTPAENHYQASSVDIMPTILKLLGIKLESNFEKPDGEPLLSLDEHRLVFSETGGLGGPWPSHKNHNVFCARLPQAKAVYYKTPDKWEFYDLKNDPDETMPSEKPFGEAEKFLMAELKKRYGL